MTNRTERLLERLEGHPLEGAVTVEAFYTYPDRDDYEEHDGPTRYHIFWRGPGAGDAALCGYLLAYDDGTFHPEGTCKKCQAAYELFVGHPYGFRPGRYIHRYVCSFCNSEMVDQTLTSWEACCSDMEHHFEVASLNERTRMLEDLLFKLHGMEIPT